MVSQRARSETPMSTMNVAAMPCENLRGLGAVVRAGRPFRAATRLLYSLSNGFSPGMRALHQRTADKVKNSVAD